MMTIVDAALIFTAPALVWVVSYLLLVHEFRTWNLLPVRIHESGVHTLSQTIFYYDHFLRELPIDTLLACAVLWSYSAAGLPARHYLLDVEIWRLGLALFLVLAFCGSVASVGVRSSLADLIQYRETDTRQGWGSHWQMHFLSTAVLLILLMLPGSILSQRATPWAWAAVLLAAFLVLSVLFKCRVGAITDPRWVLHGAREVVTYVVIVALPAFLPLLRAGVSGTTQFSAASQAAILLLAAAAGYFVYVFRKHRLDDVASSNRGIPYLLSSHFFEHILDFIYILLLILAAGS
jgi:hypothetical protein